MARGKKQKKQIGLLAFSVLACLLTGTYAFFHGTGGKTEPAKPPPAAPQNTQVYYLNVGQGDCEVIRLKTGENILIDSGNPETAQELVDVLRQLGVKKIDHLIATHPHADHIGAMAKIIQSLDIGEIYMPKIAEKQIPTTNTYEKLLKAIDTKGMKITAAKGGMTVLENGDERLEILAPNSPKYDDLNNYSVVVKLTSGEKRFLFTGDAQTENEKEMLAKGYDLKSDVLKCGHHGSSTSTSAAFLKAVRPSAAVISCGRNNDYGHPHKEVLGRLQKADVTVYRTDTQGTILAECDGKAIRFTTGQISVIPFK